LIVLANGLNIGLRHTLGMTRKVISECHSISIGFDAKPTDRPKFEFPALTYYSERPTDRTPYITLFPIGAAMRANLFVYRDMGDPWLRRFREAPQETLYAALPGLRKLMGEFEVTDRVQIRPVDLYVTTGYRQPGIVLVGDAFATSCPAAGTGARKALTDVERLCNFHVPRWLATPGMGEEKITAFYDDTVKRVCDELSLEKAYDLRAITLDSGWAWGTRRWVKFVGQSSRGVLRRAYDRLADRSPSGRSAPAVSGGSR
jgi:2-polyprenyl-6-methoxyphenol hydroxylase-like FAD-dependent oxidoreductase